MFGRPVKLQTTGAGLCLSRERGPQLWPFAKETSEKLHVEEKEHDR